MTKKKECYCSPANNNKNHFSLSSLKYLISVWNSIASNKINVNSMSAPNVMYRKLDNVLKNLVGGSNKYWLWCGAIERKAETVFGRDDSRIITMKRKMRAICKKELKPEKPESWYKNPKTWLSNWDIQNVMTQYADNPKYKYAFLGVFPIDFAVISDNGRCMYSNLCTVDVSRHLKKGKRFLGLITNLDKHNESGSHWTSTFMVIDPKLPTYGAFYYDSTGNGIPTYLYKFLQSIKEQCDRLYPDRQFSIYQNKKQHQYKNTECGVFSMVIQIRWLNKHIVRKNQTSFNEIIGNPYIDDEHMLMIRNYLFRPNTKLELQKL